jgi:hypothetical protein
MSLRSKLSLVSLLGASALMALGCSSRTTSSAGTDSNADALDTANGGIEPASKEAPAFDDPAVLAIAPMVAAPADAPDPTADPAAAAGGTSYHVLLMWGHLPQARDDQDADPTAQAADWTGSIAVPAGAIGLKRTIAFDAKDHIEPRTDPRSISFVSHTLPYVDGLLVRVVVPAGATPVLHFDTAALKADIDLAQLDAKVGGVARVADGTEGLAYIGYQDNDGCAKGFVHGRWIKDRARFGHLRGIVSAGDGDPIGHVRGLWGHAPRRAANVFFGKYIDRDGDGRGLFAGKYGDGVFGGVWGAKDEGDLDVGHLEGFYSDGFDQNDGRGVWLGRWSEKCAK